MDQQPIAYIHYNLVRILAYHRFGFTCVRLRDQSVRIYDNEARDNSLIITIKLENNIEKFYWDDDIYYVQEHYYHRDDGPAIIYANSEKQNEFWLLGEKYDDAEDYFEALTPEQKTKAIYNMNEIRS